MTGLDTTSGVPAAMPLTMSSLEIAGLTGKRHDHVLRDVRKMLATLNGPNFGDVGMLATYRDGKGEARECFNLPKRECLILVSGYSIEMRARIIDRWLQLEMMLAGPTVSTLPADMAEQLRRTDGISRMLAHKVTGIEHTMTALLALVQPHLPVLIRRGKTAGQIWREHGFPPLKSASRWFGNRLEKMGCRIEGNGRAELGMTTARLFDPDKADLWLANGGAELVKTKIAERQGQGKLRLVA